MKRFNVRLPQSVKQPERTEVVTADYMKLDAGHLAFRNHTSSPTGGYPEVVRVFAPGAWLEVEAETEPPFAAASTIARAEQVARAARRMFPEVDLTMAGQEFGSGVRDNYNGTHAYPDEN